MTEKAATLATSWGSRDTADQVRRKTEKEAFKKLIDDVEASWPNILIRSGKALSSR